MTIEQIAEDLNKKAIAEGYLIADLPELRKKHLGKKQLPSTIFTNQTVFGGEDNYAFHHGGRKEVQFNVGEETIYQVKCTRYALCFSLQPSHDLPNPIEVLEPFRKRFNECIQTLPELFDGLKMWYYQNGQRSNNVAPRAIPDAWFKHSNFISLGDLIEKPLADLTETDLARVLEGFDKLLPVYEYCVLRNRPTLPIEKRISRLCWNENGWVMPSGPHGKSNDRNSHEAMYGFGHEEWLLDTGKLIDGYHYGFLEPVRKQQAAFEDNTYDVWLYTIDSETKKRYLVGRISEVEVINSKMAEGIWGKYIENGWLEEMKQQLNAVGAKHGNLVSGPGIDVFNVRYYTRNLEINEQYVEVSADNPLLELSRYVFANYRDEFVTQLKGGEFQFEERDNARNGDDTGLQKRKHLRAPKEIEISYVHTVISKGLTKHLRQVHGKKNVSPEHPTGQGASRVDIVVRHGAEFTFYEIKTYNSLKTSIREAIGQLIEYSLWTNQNRAKKLIVVTQPHSDVSEARAYFKHLRDEYALPLYFQTYDFENDILSEEF